MQILLLRAASAIKLSISDTSTRFKVQTGCSRNRGFMSSTGKSLLCLTVVIVVCSSEIYCTEC